MRSNVNCTLRKKTPKKQAIQKLKGSPQPKRKPKNLRATPMGVTANAGI